MKIDIKADVSAALRKHRANRVRVEQAAVRSLNRTADQVKSAATKSISAELGLKQMTVREKLRVVRASRGKLESVVIGTGKPIGLINFKARQTAAGVVVTVAGKRVLYKGAFISTMPGGHRGVFRQRSEAAGHIRKRVYGRRKPSKHSLKIKEMWGPGVPTAMAQKEIFAALQKVARDRWPINFESDLRYYLNR